MNADRSALNAHANNTSGRSRGERFHATLTALRVVAVAIVLAACSSQPVVTTTTAPAATIDAAAPGMADAGALLDASSTDAAIADAAPSFDAVATVLYVEPSTCPDRRIECLFDARYRGDAKASATAKSLLDRWNIVAGVERSYTMDGGYRGKIKIEPAAPTGADRKQLDWIVDAFDDLEHFFVELGTPHWTAPARYRWRPLTFRFFRSIGARTPSAYAIDWTVAWNLNGSLNISADAVRETLVHEIFHLNDSAHLDAHGDWWSTRTLGTIYDVIVKKCGATTACLTPYTPTDTQVRGGTYYSFQPGNDVREYAAELASRYVQEQRAALRGLKLPRPRPFKCGPSENARAWSAIRDEFFGGIDAVPACP